MVVIEVEIVRIVVVGVEFEVVEIVVGVEFEVVEI